MSRLDGVSLAVVIDMFFLILYVQDSADIIKFLSEEANLELTKPMPLFLDTSSMVPRSQPIDLNGCVQ